MIYLFVMEGQGRTLEEIDTMYLSKLKPWKSSKWVAPPPHEIARIRKEAGTHDVVDEEALETHSQEDKKEVDHIDHPQDVAPAANKEAQI